MLAILSTSGGLVLESYVIWFDGLGMGDVDRVGGKNASLGEMISNLRSAGVHVPDGFATTAQAYRDFLRETGLQDRINTTLTALDVDDVNALAQTGAQIRRWIMDAPLPARLNEEITAAYEKMMAQAGGDIESSRWSAWAATTSGCECRPGSRRTG